MESSSSAPLPGLWDRFIGSCSLDRVGMWVSGACAVHCATLPLLITVAGFGWLGDERLEWTIIAFSFAIASWRLTYSYLREHRNGEPMVFFAIGAAAILFAKAEVISSEWAEVIGMTIGGSLIAWAHWRNHRRTHALATHRH